MDYTIIERIVLEANKEFSISLIKEIEVWKASYTTPYGKVVHHIWAKTEISTNVWSFFLNY
jgi:hypothetical protein